MRVFDDYNSFYGFEDLAVQIISVVFGEGLMIAAFVMFGRQNGAAAYRKFKMNEGKRKLGSKDEKYSSARANTPPGRAL